MIVGIGFTAPTPAAAFLDFLFARPAAPPPAPVYSSRPLSISVRPARAGRARAEKGFQHKRELGRRRAPSERRYAAVDRGERSHAAVDRGERKLARQASIDPVANPDWFLKDPNLRYGDVVVLKTGPVVYQGSHRVRASEDFVSLGQSSIVSGPHLRDIRMMVSGVWTPADEDGAAVVRKRRRPGR